MEGRSQVGVVGCVHIDDYATDVIRKHEKTRKDKEDDRTRHILTLNANAEPVFLTFRDDAVLASLESSLESQEPATALSLKASTSSSEEPPPSGQSGHSPPSR